MIIELGGGKGGFKEYLETGQKQGRELHRDQLDQRVPLVGDLGAFELATSLHGGDGRRYDHITLSFSERHVSDDMLQVAANEFRNHVLSAWPEAERHRVAVYAEAHRPRMLNYTNAETGEAVDRFPHIHFGIGRHDLLTGEAIEPLGFLGPQTNNLQFIDAFQESFNSRHGFSSPKDNPKITPENAVDTLARYTGARPNALGTINEKKAALEVLLQKEIIARNIITWGDFGKLIAEYGDVSKMHEGKFNECYRITPHGANKRMRLAGVFFQQQFIRRPTAEKLAIISEKAKTAYLEQMQPRKEPEYIAGVLQEWHQTKAREHRYLHTGSKFYKDAYLPADTETRRQILNDLERKHHVTSPVPNLTRKIAAARNRVPGLPARDLDGIQSRSEMLLCGDDGVDVRDESEGQEPIGVGLRQANGNRGGLGIDTDNNDSIDTPGDASGNAPGPSTGQPVRGSVRRSAGRTGWTGKLHSQPSSVIDRLVADLRERYEQAEDKERYTEIRKNLDCAQLLARLSHSHGLNPDLYQVETAKDDTPRIRCGSSALTPSDFLTKELGLPWKEAAPILRSTYEQQINSKITKPRNSKAAPSILWMDFKAMREVTGAELSQRLKTFDTVAKARRAGLADMLKASQKTALTGLSGPARKTAQAIEKLRMATAKAEFAAALKEEREALRSSIQQPQAQAWRFFLQDRAQTGNEEALAELRKLDDTARAEKMATPSFTGTIVLDDGEEKERRRYTASSFLLRSLAHTVERNGDVTFRQGGRAILRDEGRHLAVLDENSNDAIAAGLLIAQQKFGGNLSLTGSLEFQRRAVQVAVDRGIDVKFVDPHLESLRKQLVAEQRQTKQSTKTPTPTKAALTPDALDPSNKSREAEQAQRAAATAAEEVADQIKQIEVDPHQAEVATPADQVKEWFSANPEMAENKTSPFVDGRVLHVFDDGRWIQHLGRKEVVLRQPVEVELKVGQMVDFKNSKAFIVPEKGKGKSRAD